METIIIIMYVYTYLDTVGLSTWITYNAFRLFTLLEDACHELDARGLLQGGSAAYQEYVTSLRREVELAVKCDKVRDQISILDQLVTIFTLTTSIASNPSHVTYLSQLQGAILDNKKELQDMVIEEFSMAYFQKCITYDIGN